MSDTPTSRSLTHCRKLGWRPATVERYNHRTTRSVDVWGFGDILVRDDQPGAMLIQATTTDHISHRLAKIMGECYEAAYDWLEGGNRIEVWGWAKRGGRGERKLWTLRRVAVVIAESGMLANAEVK